MKSPDEVECKAAKQEFNSCFNGWYKTFQKNGLQSAANPCEELFEDYKECYTVRSGVPADIITNGPCPHTGGHASTHRGHEEKVAGALRGDVDQPHCRCC